MGILAAVAGIALLALSIQSPHTLFDKTNRAAQFNNACAPGKFDGSYRWINDREVLFGCIDKSSSHLMRLRTDRTSAAAQTVPIDFKGTESWDVSPNGRSLCRVQSILKNGRRASVVKTAAITDANVVRERAVYETALSDNAVTHFIWCGDGRSVLWSENRSNRVPAIRQLSVDTGRLKTWNLPWKDANGELDMFMLHLSRGSSDDRLILSSDSGLCRMGFIAPGRHQISNRPGYYFVDFKMNNPVDNPTEWIAPDEFYQNSSIQQSDTLSVSISPQTNRLLWTKIHERHDAWEQVRARLHLGSPAPHYLVRLVVSNMRGDGEHELASGEIAAADWFDAYPQWTPDGKHVSLAYRGDLYVVPVR